MKVSLVGLLLAFLLLIVGCNSSATSLSSPVAEAIAQENWVEAARLLDEGGDPNSTILGFPVLAIALEKGEFELAAKLADKGADLETRVDNVRLIDLFEKTAAQNQSDPSSRKAVEWLESRGVKRSP